MITAFIVCIIFTVILWYVARKNDVEFGLSGVAFFGGVGFLLGLFISVFVVPSPVISEYHQLKKGNYVIREMPNGNKRYYRTEYDDSTMFIIDEFIEADLDEPIIVEKRKKHKNTAWSIPVDDDWKYTYIYYY